VTKKTPAVDVDEIRIFVEKEISCFVIDTFEEHFKLLMSVERKLETITGEGLPFRSEFEKFVPYVYMNENFKFLGLETETEPDEAIVKRNILRNKEEEIKMSKIREQMKEDLKFELQEKYFKVLEKAQLVYELENYKSRMSKTFQSGQFCPADAIRGTALDCIMNVEFLVSYYSITCITSANSC
jgi:hypothetical protein